MTPNSPGAWAMPRFSQLSARLEDSPRIAWCRMQPRPRPCFTPTLLRELRDFQRAIERLDAAAQIDPDLRAVEYVVFASEVPEVFNLGGDLSLFLQLIQAGRRQDLLEYAYACIEPGHHFSIDLGLPLTTIALVQGDALGGGFEAALSCSVMIAERGSQLGLPEILFNMFPGMGAYTFLARRIGPQETERMIKSGRIYAAEELHEMGVVDILCDNGKGEDAVYEYIRNTQRTHNAYRAIHRARRIVTRLQYDEMQSICEIWVDAALRLTERDLKIMQRLVRAQDRKYQREEIRDAPAASYNAS
jgi:DSF synthase